MDMKDSPTKPAEAAEPKLKIGSNYREPKGIRLVPLLGRLLANEAHRLTMEKRAEGDKERVTEADLIEEALLEWARKRDLLPPAEEDV